MGPAARSSAPASTLLGGRFRDECASTISRAQEHAGHGVVPRMGAENQADPAGFKAHKLRLAANERRPGSARDPLEPRPDDHGAVAYPRAGELPRSDRLRPRPDGPLPLGIRSADLDPARAGGGIDPAHLAGRPDAAGVFGELEAVVASSRVPICTGENLSRRQSSRTSSSTRGAIFCTPICATPAASLETKRIADMAEVFGLPMATHNTGSIVNTLATVQWAHRSATISRAKRSLGQGGWMDKMVL